jgi:hypothetical protein
VRDARGFATLPESDRYDAAKKAAENWFSHLDMSPSTESHTVKAVCEAYVEKIKAREVRARRERYRGILKAAGL